MSQPAQRRSFEPQAAGDLPNGLIVFDGVCVLCSGWVRFIVARDPHAQFRFVSIQGTPGRAIAEKLGIDAEVPATNAVILDGMAYFKSDSALAVLQRLDGWRWTRVLRACPRPVRDWIYDRIARNRYALFGRTDRCMIPTADQAARFLDRP